MVFNKTGKYSTYFQALIDDPRVRDEFPKARSHNSETPYHTFNSDFSGIKYVVGFNKTEEVYTALGIYFSTHEENKNFFDVLKERKPEINAKIKVKCGISRDLDWQPRNALKRSVIGFWREGNIESDAAPALEVLKTWHIKTLLTFKEIFTPEIQRVLDKLKSSESES